MAAKTFNVMQNVGKSRYVVNFHKGVKTHKDGSPFFEVEIITNKRALLRFVDGLKADGYVEA